MKEQIIKFLNENLIYKGRGANNGVWESWPGKREEDEFNASFVELTKPHSWKTLGKIRVYYYINEYPELFSGHELSIQIALNSYLEWDTFFEGWVDDIDQLKLVFKMVGIPFKQNEN